MARITKKKAVCFYCEGKLDAGEPFCVRCERPTAWATHDQRIEWEVRQWKDSRPPSAARSARARSSSAPVHAPPPPRPRKPRATPPAPSVPDDAGLDAPAAQTSSAPRGNGQHAEGVPPDGSADAAEGGSNGHNGKILASWELEAIERRRSQPERSTPEPSAMSDGNGGVPKSEPMSDAVPKITEKPAAKKPAKPAAKKPAARKPAKPAAKKPAAKKPAKPAVKKPAVKKPAAKKPSGKRPATREPAQPKTSSTGQVVEALGRTEDLLKTIGQELRHLNERISAIEGKLDKPRRRLGRRRG